MPVTVTAIVFDVAVTGKAQLAVDVSTQLTTSLLFKVVVVNVLLFVPVFTPFTFH